MYCIKTSSFTLFEIAKYFTARKQSLRSLCFHKCLFVYRVVWQVPPPLGRYTPWQVVHLAGTPPRRYTHNVQVPPGQVHPPGRDTPWAGIPLWHQPPRPVKPLADGQQEGGTHTTGMHSC